MEWETYADWSHPGIRHLFTRRSEFDYEQVGHELRPTLEQAGFPSDNIVAAEQVHGNRVAVVRDLRIRYIPKVDALVTNLIDVPLVIRVADCGPIYLYDPVRRVVGLVHSGRKGTELNILAETVRVMNESYGTEAADLTVLLGPCIRPPHFEVNFAATIGQQALKLGIGDYQDTGLCTAANLDRYYSYRLERGQTGRMWAVLMIESVDS